jgi:hypothetical protein
MYARLAPLAHIGQDDMLKIFADVCEEISFSSEKELQSSLEDMLPPKEVVMTAHFLVQDAPNIFEQTPAQRLHIFKHMFGFIGIDHAKDKLRDVKKELETRVLVLQEDTTTKKRFQQSFPILRSCLATMKQWDILDKHLQEACSAVLTDETVADMLLLEQEMELS